MGPLLALVAALPVALLPPDAAGVPAEAVRAASASLQRALPAPWTAAALDLAALAEHLAAAGPACRIDLACLCSVVPFEEGSLALDLRVEPLRPLKPWAADLRLVVPCSGQVLDRRAAVIEPSAAALERFVRETAVLLLRGRDLAGIRWTGKASLTVTPAVPAPKPAPATPERRR